MTAAGFTFVKEGAYDRKACLVGVIAGAIGIIIAVVFVKSLPLTVLTWIVIVAIFYASIMMLRFCLCQRKACFRGNMIDRTENLVPGHLGIGLLLQGVHPWSSFSLHDPWEVVIC